MRYLVAMSAPQTRKAIATIVDAPRSFAQAKLLAAARYPDCRVVSVRAAPAGLRLDAERVEIDWDSVRGVSAPTKDIPDQEPGRTPLGLAKLKKLFSG